MEEQKNKITEGRRTLPEQKFHDFVEAAAHDLQAPLRKLSVLVERVFTKNEEKFDDNGREYIVRIESCIGEMRSLIDGFMELAKADTTAAVTERCDLNIIAGEIVQRIRDETNPNNVIIHLDSLPVLYGSSIQYKQLFKNLLENAVKFRRRDAPAKIEVKAEPTTGQEKNLFGLQSDKKYYTIEICDNGLGFGQQNAEKIFEPFVRLHPKSDFEGNGLGLFICKKIVANHHGIIYATAKEEGARFVLVLPETP
jgi:signal transduction histidine kinase